jgi:hypothetical protein
MACRHTALVIQQRSPASVLSQGTRMSDGLHIRGGQLVPCLRKYYAWPQGLDLHILPKLVLRQGLRKISARQSGTWSLFLTNKEECVLRCLVAPFLRPAARKVSFNRTASPSSRIIAIVSAAESEWAAICTEVWQVSWANTGLVWGGKFAYIISQ